MTAESTRIVFLGPSLPLEHAKAVLPDADFRPPIKRKYLTTVPSGSIVGIINGISLSRLRSVSARFRMRSTAVCRSMGQPTWVPLEP
jgi:hypothetical protein